VIHIFGTLRFIGLPRKIAWPGVERSMKRPTLTVACCIAGSPCFLSDAPTPLQS
jgi:hypothetical protein